MGVLLRRWNKYNTLLTLKFSSSFKKNSSENNQKWINFIFLKILLFRSKGLKNRLLKTPLFFLSKGLKNRILKAPLFFQSLRNMILKAPPLNQVRNPFLALTPQVLPTILATHQITQKN